jgi:hypothetical protein
MGLGCRLKQQFEMVAGPGFEPVTQSAPAELHERCILGPLEHHPLDQGGD